jgi:hypothetical protein
MRANTPLPQINLFQTILNTLANVFRNIKRKITGNSNTPTQTLYHYSSATTSTSSIDTIPPSELIRLIPPPRYQRVVTLVELENSVFEEIRQTKGQERPKTLQEPQ